MTMKTARLCMTPKISAISTVVATLIMGVCARDARCEGFRNPPASTFGLGRAGGRIAQVDDSSAVAHNPANLVDLHQTEFQFTPSVVYVSVDYDNNAGGQAETTKPWKVLPNAYFSLPIQDNRIAVGVGLSVPYGLANEWAAPLSSPLRYSAPYYTELKTINLNPSAAIRLCDKASLGLGFDVMYSELVVKQFLSPAFPDFNYRARGSGFGFSGNAGLTVNLTDGQRVAVTVRAPMNVDYDGHFDFRNEPFTGASSRTDFNSQIRFPTIVAVGYGIRLTESIRFESDVEWIQFSRFKNLPVNVGPNPYVPSSAVPQNWRDTFTAGFSLDWQFYPNWIIRGGYQFYLSPVPDSTFSPSIPDANQNVLTVGVGYKTKHHSLEFAYGLDFYEHRDINSSVNPTFAGSYDMNVHLFSAAYKFSF